MRPFLPVVALTVLASWANTTAALDLTVTKIDGTIAKESTYKNKPKYCLLVFGPEAKFRVWLVLDDDALYVDRNGNGDLTEREEQCVATGKEPLVWEAGDLIEPDGKRRHTGLMVTEGAAGMTVRIRRTDGQRWQRAGAPWMCGGSNQPRVVQTGPGRLEFAERPQGAPILHFNGPLTVHLLWPHALNQGEETDFIAVVGTPGLGNGTFAPISNWQGIPYGAELAGEVAFSNRVVGEKPILVRFAIPPNI